jgi:hypothetical protein
LRQPIGGTQAGKKAQSGYQATFDPVAYTAAMTHVRRYKCGMNLWWTNLLFSPSPGVPLANARIDLLVDYYFEEPALPFDIVIPVPAINFKPAERGGAAILHAGGSQDRVLARDRAGRAPREHEPANSASLLSQWRHSILTCTCQVQAVGHGGRRLLRGLQLAVKRSLTDVSALARTTSPAHPRITIFKQKVQKVLGASVSNKRMAEEFNKNAKLAKASEK